ncbi:hypothetical protein [Streptomyces sp. NBC_00687]|uniref:hypothetical protein n=1 Tax=Streptomyces sp. NBC_00687 TaxID=2975807 RepID=UPI00225082FB|nr:hypothetical protein [Streptomyces sp. NBC_00687]MCX4912799.1 hypothetical protein [Streptomyces sp. NBC_00687]
MEAFEYRDLATIAVAAVSLATSVFRTLKTAPVTTGGKARFRTALRLLLLVMLLGLSIIVALFDHLVWAGGFLVLAAGVRLTSPREAWDISTLKLHITSEVAFHTSSLITLAAAVDLLALGHYKNDLATGQRITITVTLALAAFVAVNKSTTRTRKLCTTLTDRVSSLMQHMEALEEIQQANEKSDKLPDKKRECFEKLDALERALFTRLNTGYRFWGTPVLAPNDAYALKRKVLGVINNANRRSDSWSACMYDLRAIEIALRGQIDVVA